MPAVGVERLGAEVGADPYIHIGEAPHPVAVTGCVGPLRDPVGNHDPLVPVGLVEPVDGVFDEDFEQPGGLEAFFVLVTPMIDPSVPIFERSGHCATGVGVEPLEVAAAVAGRHDDDPIDVAIAPCVSRRVLGGSVVVCGADVFHLGAVTGTAFDGGRGVC